VSRGSSVYEDLAYLFYMVATNAAILTMLFLCLTFFMAHYGYKSITIKLNKNKKYLKEMKKQQKVVENNYISKLEKKVKTKKKKHKE
jgi:predicted small secreted protein